MLFSPRPEYVYVSASAGQIWSFVLVLGGGGGGGVKGSLRPEKEEKTIFQELAHYQSE